jgi:hypothetical protein
MAEFFKIRCDDCKFKESCVDYGWDGCKKFTQKASEQMTNEEWIKSANTEQLAEFLADKCNEVVETVLSDASCDIGDIDSDDYWYRRADFVEWLKQPHTKE